MRGDVLDYSSVDAAMQTQEVVSHKHGLRVGSVVRTVRISRADVADFMLNQMTDNAYVSAAPDVCW
jgi:hypothetical protein